MERVYENGGDLKKTMNAIERTEDGGSAIIWLENGKLGSASNSKEWIKDKGGSGWEHIRHNHVIHPRGNQFLRYGEKYADEAEIQNLIMYSMKNGEKIIKNGDI